MSYREPMSGRFYGIFNVESEGDPIALFPSEGDAQREIERRRALPDDHDDYLSAYYSALQVDLVGAVWNSFDPDPRADNPLTPAEILEVHEASHG